MGIRSCNYIAIKAGIDLKGLKKFLNAETALIETSDQGTLFIYESNFCPMDFRENNENCVYDLEEEIGIQRYLGSIPTKAYLMTRAGDDSGRRGDWEDHPFKDNEQVASIDNNYKEIIQEVLDDSETQQKILEIKDKIMTEGREPCGDDFKDVLALIGLDWQTLKASTQNASENSHKANSSSLKLK